MNESLLSLLRSGNLDFEEFSLALEKLNITEEWHPNCGVSWGASKRTCYIRRCLKRRLHPDVVDAVVALNCFKSISI